MPTIPLQTLEKKFTVGIEKEIFSSDGSILLKALFYDIKSMAQDAKNLPVDLKKLSEDQLRKFIEIQQLKISTLESNHQTQSKKIPAKETTKNKFWDKFKTSLFVGLIFSLLLIPAMFIAGTIAPAFVISGLCYAYFVPIFFSIGALLGAFIPTSKNSQKENYERNYQSSLSAENFLLKTFEKSLKTRTLHKKQNELEVDNTNKNPDSDSFSFRLFSDPNLKSDSKSSTQNSSSALSNNFR